MPVYDLEEQEKIDELKAWWKTHGTTVILAAAVFFASLAGFQGWRYYQKSQAEQAAGLYGKLQKAVADNDVKTARAIAATVMDKFSATSYAPRAALAFARASLQTGDAQSAKTQYQWVLDHAAEEELKDATRLRLAGILLDEKNYPEALKLLDNKHGESFSGLYADLKGDILASQGKLAEARSAYQDALAKTDRKSPYHNLMQLKLDALGAAK